MKTTKILDLVNNGVCIAVDGQFLYTGKSGAISKYRLENMSQTAHITISRKKRTTVYDMLWFSIFDEYIFVIDLCNLHMVQKSDLQLLYTVRLGEDLSSHVLGVLDFNSPHAYINIRNGRIDVFNVFTKKAIRFEVCYTSGWAGYCVTKDHIYYSTVKGTLLEIDKDSMQATRKLQLTKNMNIYSVVPYNGMLYTTSKRDIKVVDINSFEIAQTVPDVFHSTEAQILGVHGGAFVAVELKRIALLDIQTLQLHERFDFPTGYRFLRYAVLHGDKLYGSDEHGIYCCDLINGRL